MRRRVLAPFGLLLVALVVAGLLAGQAGAAQAPDVTGSWSPTTGGCPWHLTASGPGHDMLHMTWSGSCSSGGHTALNGVFNGSLSGSTYAGNFQIVESSTRITGTMSCRVVSTSRIICTLHPTGGNPSTVILTHHATLETKGGPDGPLFINVDWSESSLVTAPIVSPGCPGPTEPAIEGYGHFQGHRSLNGDISGGGGFSIPRPVIPCHGPAIVFNVTSITVTVAPAAHVIAAVLGVTISGPSANVQTGQCRNGLTGTVTLTENDAVIAANSYPTDTVKFGPWSAPGCNAFGQLITNNISKITAGAKGSIWDRVFIGCLHTDGSGGFGPRNCLEG